MNFLLKKYGLWLSIIILILAAIVIFWKRPDWSINPGPRDNVVENKSKQTFVFNDFLLSFNSPQDWLTSSSSSGLISDKIDQLDIKTSEVDFLKIKFWPNSKWQEYIKSAEVESESQTEINGHLGLLDHFLIDNQRIVAYSLPLSEYSLVISSGLSNLANLELLKQSLSITWPQATTIKTPEIFNQATEIVTKIYFPSLNPNSCQATGYLTVKIKDFESGLDLIPKIVKIITQQNSAELQQFSLSNFVNPGVKLISFGYDNNQVVVNFADPGINTLTECQKLGFVSQVSQSLFELNKTTDLKIKSIRIEVDGITFRTIP